MEHYLIHTCNARIWYVEKFLVPSMKEQGITSDEISIYNDTRHEGQIVSLLNSYSLAKGKDTWHLQDDIVISRNFKALAEKYDDSIACGFCNSYSKGNPGRSNIWNMWYSMPCIRIPDYIFGHFVSWMKEPNTQKKFRHYFNENKHDDVFLEFFLKENYPELIVWNVAPNMVNHIDHLIGGSLINKDRGKEPSELMATYWDEPKLLREIEEKLKERREIV